MKTKTEKWNNKRVSKRFTINGKKAGLDVSYENGKINFVAYGFIQHGILWSNDMGTVNVMRLLKKIKDPAVRQAVIDHQTKEMKQAIRYAKNNAQIMKKSLENNTEKLRVCTDRLNQLRSAQSDETVRDV